jgi:probable HAF family extracellular repeat protein
MRKLAFPLVMFPLLVSVYGCGEKQSPLEPESVGEASLEALTVASTAPEYSATILTPLPGAERMLASAINGDGHIVGWALVEDFIHPVVWEDGQPHELPLSAFAEGLARDINNTGDIVGHDDELGAVMWTNGELIALGVFTIGSGANGINQRGQIVGNIEFETSPPEARGFLWTDGQLSELPPLGDSPECSAVDINGAGQIVGVCSSRAVLWDNGSVADLGLDSNNSVAGAINSSGHVVGRMQVAENEHHAFVWRDGVTEDLPTLGGVFTGASDINDPGQIVGTSRTPAGQSHAVLWDNGQLIDLGLAGGTRSSATGIDNRGRIVGYTGESAVIWERH